MKNLSRLVLPFTIVIMLSSSCEEVDDLLMRQGTSSEATRIDSTGTDTTLIDSTDIDTIADTTVVDTLLIDSTATDSIPVDSGDVDTVRQALISREVANRLVAAARYPYRLRTSLLRNHLKSFILKQKQKNCAAYEKTMV